MKQAAAQPFTIRVISLVQSPRRAVFTERAKTSLDWDFLDAHTSNTTGLPYDDRKSELIYGRVLTHGERACFASHYALWRFCAHSNQPVVIFEDDVDPDWSFLEALARDYQTYAGIDFLRFWAIAETRRIPVGDIVDRRLVELLDHPLGMQGYLLTPRHAKRLVKRLRRMSRPVDDEFDRVWQYGAPNLIVDPPPLSLREEPSEIGERLDYHDYNQKGLLRTALRILEKVQKEAYFALRLLRLRALSRAPSAR
jgi:glycosyl transferase family 25